MDLDSAIDGVIAREGDYTDNPADRGGPTRFGITQGTARANGYAGDMRALPRSLAATIYRRLYWTAPGFDRIATRSPDLATSLFDTAVNMGAAVAIGFLQRALNALNRGAADYPDMALDGRIGPATIAALDAFLARRGAGGAAVLIKAVEALKGERYLSIAEARPADEAFVYGWLANRTG